jgi:hypothetical protein
MNHHHHSLRRACALASLTLASCGVLAGAAQAHQRPTIAPARHVAGLTGGELLAESWAQRLVLPADNPFVGRCQRLGHGRQVLSPVIGDDGTASCAARPGTPVFLRFGSFCDDVEPPPFFGADEAAQRACAVAADEAVLALRIAVDGGTPRDIRREPFELISPQVAVQLPPDNIVGVPPQPMTFVAHAWGALVAHLCPGRHTITFEIVFPDDAFTATVFVTVMRS